MKLFTDLGIDDKLLRGLGDLGFTAPTPIQEQIIPTLLNSQTDVIGLAQSGTGKTAAFGIPLIQLTDTGNKQTQALVLCPTRELCVQVAGDVTAFGKYLPGVKVLAVYGGANIESQINALRKGVQIVVATPGRLNDLMRRGAIDITAIRTVVLDEADEMLQMGFQEELNAILAVTPADKITLLFSATMPREVSALAGRYMRDPIEITVGRRNAGADNVSHEYYVVPAKDRYPALKRIVDVNPDIYSIIFCRTRQETQEIADKLIQDGYNAEALHGDLSQVQRDTVMNKFRRRNTQLLVATDVAARGLDVDDLTHVINYNLPDDTVNYTHRSGRTGRAGKIGISIALIHMRENHRIKELEGKLKKKFTKGRIPTGREICEKQLFKLIDTMKKVDVDHREIDPFVPAVMEILKELDREELVKKFVSIAFNRFLDYYRNAPDLNISEYKKGREAGQTHRVKEPVSKAGDPHLKSKRSHNAPDVYGYEKPHRDPADVYRNKKAVKSSADSSVKTDTSPPAAATAFTRLKINVGKKDGATPNRLMGEINEIIGDRRIRFGKIDITQGSTLLEVESRYAARVQEAFQDVLVDDKPVIIETASDDGIRDEQELDFRAHPPLAKRRQGNDRHRPFKRSQSFQSDRTRKGKVGIAKRGMKIRNASKTRRPT
jgi:ATP-dependent RNA helicase DeaD